MLYRIVITTSDAYVKLLGGFAHQWNKYCGLPVTVVWRNIEPAKLPDNFTLLQAPARWHDWSGSLLQALDKIDDELILLGLEDFWLSAKAIDIDIHAHYMIEHPDVQRMDLTDDRKAYSHVMRDGYYQAVIDPSQTQYLCSSQFSIWRKSFLQHALVPGELPPHFEVEGSKRVVSENPVIIGAGYRPLPYSGDGVVWNGRIDNLHTEYLTDADVMELRARGFIE